MSKLDLEVVRGVATLLCQHAATHEDFFARLAMEMAKRGYNLECHQRGIQGTYICVVKQT